MKFLKYALVVLFSAGLMSCGGSSGGGDDEKPDTEPAKILNITPAGDLTISASEDLQIAATITDNMELSTYRVLLTPVGTGALVKGDASFNFDSKVDKDAEGKSLPVITAENNKSLSLDFKVDLEQAAAQNYTLTIEADDVAPNEKTVVTRTITVTRP